MGGGAAYATISRLSAASGAAATRQQDDDQEDQPRLRWRRVGRVFNALGADAAPGADAGPSVNDVNQVSASHHLSPPCCMLEHVLTSKGLMSRRVTAQTLETFSGCTPPSTAPQLPQFRTEDPQGPAQKSVLSCARGCRTSHQCRRSARTGQHSCAASRRWPSQRTPQRRRRQRCRSRRRWLRNCWQSRSRSQRGRSHG